MLKSVSVVAASAAVALLLWRLRNNDVDEVASADRELSAERHSEAELSASCVPVIQSMSPAPSSEAKVEVLRTDTTATMSKADASSSKKIAEPFATPAPEVDAAALGSRVATILDQLRPTIAGSESRRLLVLELLEVLQGVSSGGVKVQRKVARAFVDSEGPELVYHLESSMSGNWVADAKNGTMKALSGISRLPGPIGHAMLSYRRLAEKNKLDAADQRCSHPGENPHGPRR